MPSFDFLPDKEIKALVGYLRYLGGGSWRSGVKGNPDQGEALFFGRAECNRCHMMRGKGGFLGSDLSDFGRTHSPAEATEAILNPNKSSGTQQQVIRVVTRTGQRLSGVARNEDNFSLQLLDLDGTFHLLMKTELTSVVRDSDPLMPGDYGKRLSPTEIEDLVSYLMIGGGPNTDGPAGRVR